MSYHEDGRAILTLVIEAAGVPDGDKSVREFLASVEDKDEIILYLAGWISGHFANLAEYQEHLRQVDRFLG